MTDVTDDVTSDVTGTAQPHVTTAHPARQTTEHDPKVSTSGSNDVEPTTEAPG